MNVKDRHILRGLAQNIKAYASQDIQDEKKTSWTALNDLQVRRPMVLVSPEGAWSEIATQTPMLCEDPLAKSWEWQMRQALYHAENIKDDTVITRDFIIPWKIDKGNFGVEISHHTSEMDKGAFKHIPAIQDLERDLERLKFRQPTVYREETLKELDLAQQTFGDILNVKCHSSGWWTMGLTIEAIALIGLEELMMAMMDEPDELHQLMDFLKNDMIHFMDWHLKEGLLGYNNNNTVIGSGNWGLVSDLPTDQQGSTTATSLKDLWGFSESQETVGVSPTMFAEFIWPYQKPLMEKFGLTYYGCCEPVELRYDYIREMSNLRCLSVSPWSDVKKCAELYSDRYVMCRKPNPAMVCTRFNEDEIRNDLRASLEVAGELNLVLILKDTHTIAQQPERFHRWVQIAREEIERVRPS